MEIVHCESLIDDEDEGPNRSVILMQLIQYSTPEKWVRPLLT